MYTFNLMNECKFLSNIKAIREFNIFVLVLMLTGTGSIAWAGGLVDTSSERFTTLDFTDSQYITNQWWTLEEDENRLYYTEADGECVWNLVEVLDTTDGFRSVYADTVARIVLDREWVDEECNYTTFEDVWANLEPSETTYDWYAQDSEENIWYMGEDTWDGESSEGSFVAGCDGAEAGIVMLSDPRKGDFYRQEFYEGEAEDWGKVLNFVKLDGQEDKLCLMTKEWTPLERGHIEHKIYCSDGITGDLVLVRELKGKTVYVELIAENVMSVPPPPEELPSPVPECE